MVSVRVTGWKYGYDKVACTKLLAHEGGFGLSKAKAAVDEVLDGKVVSIELGSLEEAQRFLDELHSINAVAQIDEGP